MPTENRSSNAEQMVSVPFERETRYLVVKLSKLDAGYATGQLYPDAALAKKIEKLAGPALIDCVVVEKDWPEYEPVWSMIEARVTGRPTSDGFSAGDMADQGAKAFRDGVKSSADLIQKRIDDYLSEFGTMDPETGSVELPRGGDEYVGELQEIIEAVRALPLPQ